MTALREGAEFDLIRAFLEDAARIGAAGEADAGPAIILGPGDDCAVIAGGRVAISTDSSIEDVHFRRSWLSPEEIGYRAAAASLSDLAAVAATPVGLLVNVAVTPDDARTGIARALMSGVSEAAAEHGASLLGGDLSRSPGPIMLCTTVIGAVTSPVRRAGAEPGDTVWLTGAVGGAGAAVRAWEDGLEPTADQRMAFARPAPRIREGLWLAQRALPHAMIDVSDGIAGDAAHLAVASGVRIVIEPHRIPQRASLSESGHGPNSADTRASASAHGAAGRDAQAAHERLLLAAGEDYELLFTAAPGSVEADRATFEQESGVALTPIGTVEAGSGVILRDEDGTERPPPAAHDHFA